MTKNKLLIIGADGFLGYNLALNFVSKKYKVFLLSKNKRTRLPKIKKANYMYCSLTNKKKIQNILNNSYDYIFNFSGNINHKNKSETKSVHYDGLKNLIFALKKNKPKLFIQAGSSLEYGRQQSPQKEKKNNFPRSIYGQAKNLASNFLLKQKPFNFIILRMYQIYGPYQKKDRLIPIAITSCLKNKKFNCTEGVQERDFLFVDDFVELIEKIIKRKNLKSDIYNVGFGKPIAVKEVIKKIHKITKKGQPNYGGIKMRNDEIISLYPDISKVKKKFKWVPKTKLTQGLKKTIKYYEKK